MLDTFNYRSVTAAPTVEKLENIAIFHHLKRFDLSMAATRADGTCLVDSILKSLAHQKPNEACMKDPNILQDLLVAFCHQNAEQLQEFYLGSEAMFLKGVEDFFLKKQYNSQIGDMMPMLVASALNINVFVIQEEADQILLYKFDVPGAKFTARLHLLYNKVHKKQAGNHYTALVPCSQQKTSYADVVKKRQARITDMFSPKSVKAPGIEKKGQLSDAPKSSKGDAPQSSNGWTTVKGKKRESSFKPSSSSTPLKQEISAKSPQKKRRTPLKNSQTPKKPPTPLKKSQTPKKPSTPLKKSQTPKKPSTPAKMEETPKKPSTPAKMEETEEVIIISDTPEKNPPLPSSSQATADVIFMGEEVGTVKEPATDDFYPRLKKLRQACTLVIPESDEDTWSLPSLSSPVSPAKDFSGIPDEDTFSVRSATEDEYQASSQGSHCSTATNVSIHSISSTDFEVTKSKTEPRATVKDVGLNFGDQWPAWKFFGIKEDHVDMVPENIDGLCVYRVENLTKETYWRATGDGRHWDLNTCRTARFHGIRKIGWCLGHWECPNDDCFFKATSKGLKRNTHAFSTREHTKGMVRECKTCRTPGIRKHCGARKCIEFSPTTGIAKVYHIGFHKCVPNYTNRREKIEVAEDVQKMENKVPPKVLQRQRVTAAMARGDFKEADRLAAVYMDLKYTENCQKEMGTQDKNSYEAIANLKEAWDKEDPYYIYEAQDGRLNNSITYVFKTSKWAAEIGCDLDMNADSNPFSEVPVYFDGSHSRVMGKFLSLGLWTYHHTTHRLIRLASMDVKSESTVNIAKFWELWNKVLSDFSKRKDYKFNPSTFVTDEAGGNFTAIKQVYGEEATEDRVQTCLLHFQQSVLKHEQKCASHLQDMFKQLARQLEDVQTVVEYKELRTKMLKVCKGNEDLENWIVWWDKRRGHLFKAFKGTVYSGSNMAEVGNAMWTRGRKLSLVDAAYDDICTLIILRNETKAYMDGRSTVTGKVPTIEDKAAKERGHQLRRAKAMAAHVGDMEAISLHAEEVANPSAFVPGGGEKHKPQKKKQAGMKRSQGAEGLQLNMKMSKKRKRKSKEHAPEEGYMEIQLEEEPTTPEPCTSQRRDTSQSRDFVPASMLLAGADPWDSEDEAIPPTQPTVSSRRTSRRTAEPPTENEIMDKIVEAQGFLSHPVEHYIRPLSERGGVMMQNPPEVVVSVSCSRCQGCHGVITLQQKSDTHNLVFMKMGMSNWGKNSKYPEMWRCNYMHLTLPCLQKYDTNCEAKHLKMKDSQFIRLTAQQLEVLKERHLLPYIIANKL